MNNNQNARFEKMDATPEWKDARRAGQRSSRKLPSPERQRRRIFGRVWIGLAALLLLPGLTAWKLAAAVDPRWSGGFGFVISATAFLLYWQDKRRAQAGGWRTPEATLHLVELLGGWPGAWLAQQMFRHKTAKRSYQAVFWTIVGLHQLLAADYLFGWPGVRVAARWFGG